jgi:PfaB family protein
MEKIAVIGLSCLFPDAPTPDQFWQNLINGKDSKSPATAQEMGADPALFYDPVRGRMDKSYYLKGSYIRNFRFDPQGYALPAEFLESLDELFKWPLYVAQQALVDSGQAQNRALLDRTGVILGHLCLPTKSSYQLASSLYMQGIGAALGELLGTEQLQLEQRASTPAPHNILIAGYPAALVAQALGLRGVNFSLDAACASSLYAVRLACQYLQTRRADLMLAGAVSCAHPLLINAGFATFHAFPENGISQPLTKDSGGLTTGEGAGMLVLKRLSDALRDGDRIYATICGVGLSNDGRGKHLLSPNPRGQVLAFERAYTEAATQPQDIAYVECHATGTPLGDLTELNSMETFFGSHTASPLIGSVKSNFGHLLTAAGMTSMIKVILSMNHGVIPPTISVDQPLSSEGQIIGAEQVVRTTTPWPNHGPTKRAGVSAFGFGGTNAHAILEYPPQQEPLSVKEQPLAKEERLAIVGMDAHFGSLESLTAFEEAIFSGTQHFNSLPPERWKGLESEPDLLKDFGFSNGEAPKGAYVGEFSVDVLQLRIPPNEAPELNPQQLLMLKVANNALQDSGLAMGGNVAVIVALGTELSSHRPIGRLNLPWQLQAGLERAGQDLPLELCQELQSLSQDSLHNGIQVHEYVSMIGNVVASRIAALWDFTGPAFTLSSEENSTFKALEIAQMLLNSGQVEAVVVGAVDFAGGIESVCLRNQLAQINTGAATLGFDRKVNGWLVGEGAGAVVLKRYIPEVCDGNHVYAVLDSLALLQQPHPVPTGDYVAQTCHQALTEAGLEACQIGYLEAHASGLSNEDEAEIDGLNRIYQAGAAGLYCTLGSVKANIGHTWAAAGMASLIKVALCLYHRYLPATPGWSGPKTPEDWQGSAFCVSQESRPWFTPQGGERRVAAINSLGIDGTCAHLILSEDSGQNERPNSYLERTPMYLFPIGGEDREALLGSLDVLMQNLEKTQDQSGLATLARHWFEGYLQDVTYVVAIVGKEREELIREIQRAYQGVADAFAQGKDWKTPTGSYFTATPLGPRGQVAFVYPGAFNSYVGMGREVFRMFPNSYRSLEKLTADPAQMFHDSLLYPRRLEPLSQRDLDSCEDHLGEDAIAMLESGTSLAVCLTDILRKCFRVKPQAAFGYSLGETSMLYALGIWEHCDVSRALLHTSPLFQTRLSGPLDVVRDYEHLPQSPERAPEEIWATHILRMDPESLRECLKTNPQVYLTHINTPEEVVIAGDPTRCEEVIASLGCDSFQSPSSYVLHCEVMASEYEEFIKLSNVPVVPVPGIRFYSSAEYQLFEMDSTSIAQGIAKGVCQSLDFPRLVEQSYQDGVRVFIELGAASTCSRWISETLCNHPHIALSLNRRGADDSTSLVQALAKLLSHRVQLDLSPLYEQTPGERTVEKSLIQSIVPGGGRIRESLLSPANRAHFSQFSNKTKGLLTQPRGANAVTPEPTPFPLYNPSISLNERQVPDAVHPVALSAQTGAVANTIPYWELISQHKAMVQKFEENRSFLSQGHVNFLNTQRESIRQLGALIKLQATSAEGLLAKPSNSVIWDEQDLLEFAEGQIAPVFGQEYAVIDTYPRRVRLPGPPYLLVSRVTQLHAQRGAYVPCFMQTEYDIPNNAWYSVDKQVPLAVAGESGQCDLLLISYLGIDFENQGHRVYRVLNATLTFFDDLPKEGQTLRYDIHITSFARSGDALIFFFNYQCFIGERLVLKLDGGCAGFFSDEELEQGKGVIATQPQPTGTSSFEPLLSCSKSTFLEADLDALTRGDLEACFGAAYAPQGRNPSLRLPPSSLRMIDRVSSVDLQGGGWGLGLIVAEKDLKPEDWYFLCHFKDDPVLAGSLVSEGCFQLLQFYSLLLGFQPHTSNARFQPILHLPQTVQCRGQIRAEVSTLVFHLEVTKLGLTPEPFAIGNIDVLLNGKVMVRIQDMGLRLSEKSPMSRPVLTQSQ